MNELCTKADLYEQIDIIRARFHINLDNYPVNFLDIVQGLSRTKTSILPLKTRGARGISVPAFMPNENDVIILNANRSNIERNFDCSHEYLHLVIHRNQQRIFRCYDKIREQQNPFFEWQANEGAAELLVPYKLFIPEFYRLSKKYRDDDFPTIEVVDNLSKLFGVTTAVIENRISNLNQELYQYRHENKNINQIRLIAQNQAKKEDLPRRATYLLHCKKCYSLLDEKYKYCPICGEQVIGDDFIKMNFYDTKRAKGAGYMKYKEYATDEQGKLTECLECNNSSFSEDAKYCHICGKPIKNKCAGEDFNGNVYTCEEAEAKGIPSNARFCPYCGSETSFNKANILPDWNKEREEYDTEILSDFTPLDDAELPYSSNHSSAADDYAPLPEPELPF